jgi:predicted RNA-binding protein with PUA domain
MMTHERFSERPNSTGTKTLDISGMKGIKILYAAMEPKASQTNVFVLH